MQIKWIDLEDELIIFQGFIKTAISRLGLPLSIQRGKTRHTCTTHIHEPLVIK